MNTLPTRDPMRPRPLLAPPEKPHQDAEPSVTSGEPHGHDWREQVHADLRGHTFEEQEQMLDPQRAHPGGPPALDTLKESRESPSRRPPERPRNAPGKDVPGKEVPAGKETVQSGPKRKAPPPPKGRSQDPRVKVSRPELKRDRREPPKLPAENKRVSQRLAEGGKGAGLIMQGVQRAQQTHEKKVKARAEQIAKEGKKSKLTPLPPLDHAGAATALGHTKSVLDKDARTAGTMVEPVPTTLLSAAADTVDMTADRIAKKVEAPHVASTRDLAVGLREGNDVMIRRVLGRASEISLSTLEPVRTLSQNKEANVYEMKYLGMAPVVYKRSVVEDLESENDDPTLREHQTMRSLREDPNLLKAGGRTLEARGFIMELVKKGDLDAVRRKLIALPLAERVEVWRHLTRSGFLALAEVHATGRSHGDVKNQNFLLGDDYEPRLMDFGTTRNDKDAKRTGTAEYMAPEVPTTQKANKKADVWSMGESLLLGVFGMNSSDFARGGKEANPNRYGEETGRAKAVADGKWLTHVREQVKSLPDAEVFIDFIQKVMATDPKKRFDTRQALRHDFLKLAQGARNRGKDKLRELM